MTIKRRKIFKLVLGMLLTIIALWWTNKYFNPFLGFGGQCDVSNRLEDFKLNMERNQATFYELEDYLKKVLPERIGISFGFDKRCDRYYLVIRKLDGGNNVNYYAGDGLRLHSKETLRLAEIAGLGGKELKFLVRKLKALNCVGVFRQPYSSAPIVITYRKGGLFSSKEMSYYLFNYQHSDSLANTWVNKKISDKFYTAYNDSILLEYAYGY